MILIYTTCGSIEEVEKIADVLLSEKLAVCCKFWPVSTRYLWKGKKENGDEIFFLLETSEEKSKETQALIQKLHSYKSPVIVSFPVSTNTQTAQWMKKELAVAVV